MRTTIKDIAERTGFSIATVSMVLSGKDRRISEPTRAKVLEVAKELNYRPNQAAVNLKLNRSMTIGLVCPDISNEYYASIAKGIEDVCRTRGFSLMLCNTSGSWEREFEYLEILESKGVDGVMIFNAPNASTENMRRLAERLAQDNLPVVHADYLPEIDRSLPNWSYVVADSYVGGRVAAEHLWDLGHRRICIFSGPPQFNTVRKRVLGFENVLEERGGCIEPGLKFYGDFSFNCGLSQAKAVADCGCTAVFAANDMMALGLIHALRRMGLQVPGDISVIGFDNIFAGEIAEVALTTVDQSSFEVGQRAGRILCDAAEKKLSGPQDIHLIPRLIVRDSTGPAKA